MRTLPDGTLVFGSRQDRVRFEYSTEERVTTAASAQHEIKDQVGGLFFVKPGGPPVRNSSLPKSNAILGDQVRDVIADEQGAWLCTSLGVARVDRDDRVRERFTRANGLCSNRVTGVVGLNGKTYFATAWGDSGGGLAIFDPATSLFTSISHQDGLPTDKLDSVQVVGQQLRLNFGLEYLRFNAVGEQRYRQFGPVTFDPQTQTVTPAGEPKLMPQNEAEGPRQRTPLPKWVPFLGGFATKSMQVNGRMYLAGLRGIVISEGLVAEPKFAELGAKISATSPTNNLADAESRPVNIQSPDELATALKDNNPLFRANALASLLRIQPLDADYLPLIASQLNSRDVRLRSTALYFVTKFDDDKQVVPLLKAQLDKSDRLMRTLAVVELARRGHLASEKLLSEIIESDRGGENYPFGAKSSIGVAVSRDGLIEVLASRADSVVFRLLLKNPPTFQVGYKESEQLFAQLGESLRRDPSSADVLLNARDPAEHHIKRRDFARDVFLAAGKPLLPRLHAALQSDDRVIRSNAARGCGAIADPSSLQPLLKAIDLESSLSRASIVWALGRLKSAEALPLMAKLYAEAKVAQQRESQANPRYSQQVSAVTSQYQRIANLESLTAEWNELKESALSPVVNPRHEELLRPEHILEAVAAIGPEMSQEFYRALAASPDSTNRDEAAEHLSAAAGDDRPKSLAILKNLLKDDAISVRTRAAVSLIQLDDLTGRDVLLEALKSKNSGDKYHAVHQLARLQQRNQLDFAKAQLQAIATDRTLVPGLREFTTNLLRRIQP